ncbi:peptidoglycan-binding protein ArfA [Mycobacterium sp. MAA66]
MLQSPTDGEDAVSQSDESGRWRLRSRRGLIVVAAILLVLAAIGWLVFGISSDTASKNATATTTAEAVPGTTETTTRSPAVRAELSLNRDGHDVTLAGALPDDAARSEFVSAVKSQWPTANVVDNVKLAPGVGALDLAGIGGLLTVASDIPDFGMAVNGADLTLTGTAPNLDVASQVQSTATLAFPTLKLTNNLQIPASDAPPIGPVTPAPNAVGTPAGPTCPTLQADIAGLLRTPISFTTGGAELAGDSRQLVAQIAAKIKACPAAAVTVVGYTDNVGSESINQHLSAVRAKAVADALVADGVAAEHVSSRGAGSANPIASNDTPTGRAQNRRVAITVN